MLAIEGQDNAFCVVTMDRHGCEQRYGARKVVLATGYYDVANRLNVPGEDLPKVLHYYKEPHPYYDQDVLVVGREELGGYLRAGTFLDRGACHPGTRGAGIHHHVKYWIKPNIENRIKSGEIKSYFHSRSD